MRVGFAVMFAVAALATISLGAKAQDAAPGGGAKAGAAKAKSAPKSTMVRLCPSGKVNVTCAQTEKCCYHPLFDSGSCIAQSDGCSGIVNPLPLVAR